MGEWREVPGGTDAPVHRYRGMHVPVEHVAQQVDDLRADAGAPRGERVRAEQQDRAHGFLGEEPADADRVTAHEIALQRAQLLVRHADGREVTEARVHPVHGVLVLGDLRDHLGGLLDLLLGRAIEAHRDVATGDGHDVGDREVVTGQAKGRHRR